MQEYPDLKSTADTCLWADERKVAGDDGPSVSSR